MGGARGCQGAAGQATSTPQPTFAFNLPPIHRQSIPSPSPHHSQEKGTNQGQWWANAIAASLAETPGEPWERVALRQMSGLVLVVFCRQVRST